MQTTYVAVFSNLKIAAVSVGAFVAILFSVGAVAAEAPINSYLRLFVPISKYTANTSCLWLGGPNMNSMIFSSAVFFFARGLGWFKTYDWGESEI